MFITLFGFVYYADALSNYARIIRKWLVRTKSVELPYHHRTHFYPLSSKYFQYTP